MNDSPASLRDLTELHMELNNLTTLVEVLREQVIELSKAVVKLKKDTT